MNIKVGILGATGSVGQRFVQLLSDHPWFEIVEVAASSRSADKKYKQAAKWVMPTPLPDKVANMTVKECKPNLDCNLVFSGLDSSVAGGIETDFAEAGYTVISNARNHRYDEDVPLMIPEINPEHMQLIEEQDYKGTIVTNPNCSTIGMVLALAPIVDEFGIEAAQVVTLQAVSGAGYPGVSSMDAIDNVVPYISGEEEKMVKEPHKILGEYKDGKIEKADLKVSPQCNRVAVIDGHLESISIKLEQKASKQEIIDTWTNYSSMPQEMDLPMAPKKPVHYFEESHLPQPKLQRNIDKGMAISTGRLQDCAVLDYKFIALSHNTIRGAAGASILNAEYMIKKGILEQ